MNNIKSLSSLKSYDEFQQASSEFLQTQTAIDSTNSRISNIRKSLANTDRSYNSSLASDEVSYRELENLRKKIDDYRQTLIDQGEKLKSLKGELPDKEKALEKAENQFMRDAWPIIKKASENAAQAWQSVKEANNILIEIRKQCGGTPLAGRKELPGFESDRIESLDKKFMYVFKGRLNNE